MQTFSSKEIVNIIEFYDKIKPIKIYAEGAPAGKVEQSLLIV